PFLALTNKLKTIHKSPSIFTIILQTISIMEHQIVTLQLARCKPDFLILPLVEFIKPLEFFRAEEAISAGEKAITSILPEIKEKIKA
ncbi:hypothetical protein KAW65_07700, partial [candidate division WOR-3 bacterium]|nr:hypothetical protein [candidate division WOR-3 bacterium]